MTDAEYWAQEDAKVAAALQQKQATPKLEPIAQTLSVMMTESQARACIARINQSIKECDEEIKRLLLDLYEREGWKALGYSSWRECGQAEFKHSQSRVYQLLDAAKVERNISNALENDQPPLPARA